MDEPVFECPECKTDVTMAMAECPGCGTELSWEGGGGGTEQTDVTEATEAPGVPEEDAVGSVGGNEVPPSGQEDDSHEGTPPPARASAAPRGTARRYGGFSLLGLAMLVLAVIAIVATIVLMRYDTLIAGADEDVIGDVQMNYILLSIVGFVVFFIGASIDLLRGRGARHGPG